MLIEAVDRFARRTAEACVNLWDRDRTIEMMAIMGPEYEQEVVKQIEQIQLEIMQGDDGAS